MYSRPTVSIRIGASWCVEYCVNKDRDFLVHNTVSIRIGIFWCVQYCVSKDKNILVCTLPCQ